MKVISSVPAFQPITVTVVIESTAELEGLVKGLNYVTNFSLNGFVTTFITQFYEVLRGKVK